MKNCEPTPADQVFSNSDLIKIVDKAVTIHDNPIPAASLPSFVSMHKVFLVACALCLFHKVGTCATISALPHESEVTTSVTAILLELAADIYLIKPFQRCKIKGFNLMIHIEFTPTLTQAADSATVNSSFWRHGSADKTISLLDGDTTFLFTNQGVVTWLGVEPKCRLYNFWVQNVSGAAMVEMWSRIFDSFAHPSDPSDGLQVPDQSVGLTGGNPNLSFKFLHHIFGHEQCLKVILSCMARVTHAVLTVIG